MEVGLHTFPPNMMEDIQYFFREIHPTLIPGQLLYPEVFLRPDFFPLQRMAEMEIMFDTVKKINPKTVMEIGTDKGGSLYHWCMSFPTVERVIACEIRGTPFRNEFEKAFPHIQFLWLPCSSYGNMAEDERKPTVINIPTPNYVREWLKGDKINCLFIDGDKSRFRLDFDLYRPLVSDSGIVLMHDIQDSPGPKEAFNEVISRGYGYRKLINISEVAPSLRRQQNGVPPTTAYESWLRHWAGRSCGVGIIYMKEGLK